MESAKCEFEKKVKLLEEYDKNDSETHPAWTFFLPNVIQLYGVCPFLSSGDGIEKRVEWLTTQSDGGQLYCDELAAFNDTSDLKQCADNTEDLKSQMRSKLDFILPLVGGVTHDTLMDQLRERKEAKSHNKKSRETWAQMVRTMDALMVEYGVDFCKYINIVHGYTIRYKPPTSTVVPADFHTLLDLCAENIDRVSTGLSKRQREKEIARDQLAKLISQNFRMDQIGRYFKKWSALSDDKKTDRIQSYSEWYARDQNVSIGVSYDMTNWILSKLKSKELKTSDIQWHSKTGIITHVKLIYDGDFQVVERVPKTTKKKTSKQKKQEFLQNDQLVRVNRLLLYEIVKDSPVHKTSVVDAVVFNLHLRVDPTVLRNYISSQFDEMLQVIQSTPPPNSELVIQDDNGSDNGDIESENEDAESDSGGDVEME